MKKIDLIQKLKHLDGVSQDERAYLINLVNTKKKYGLVWEDKPEDVEEQLRNSLPLLKEIKVKAIIKGEDFPNHILIEGDNLHAITALTFTHEGKVDVIYIDPPYNTKNKDFKYNDTYVDYEDSYRHSKWLSFMGKRLEIAKRLLSTKGIIFINIDDNEQAQLKLMCDEIFGESNFIAQIIWQKRTSPDARRILGPAHDNIYCYGKSSLSYATLNHLGLTEDQEKAFKNPDNDPNGPWVSSDFTAQGYRPNQMYEITTPGGSKYSPPEGRCWKNVEDVFKKQLKEGKMWFGVDGKGMPRRKTYLKERKGSVPWTWWDYKTSGNNQDAKKEIIEVLGTSTAFSTPKPIKLLHKIISIASNKKSIILDFFAGSGTTLHSTMLLNAEDEGNRQCILVTNNENNICEEVTYERSKRVIQGYTNAKGVAIEGLINNNLRYFKSDFVSRDISIKNKKDITKLATELLCIKEDIYTEKKNIGDYQLNATYVKCFKHDNLYLLIIYDEDIIEQIVSVILNAVKKAKGKKLHFKVYVFSNGQYPYTEEFEEVLEHISLCALPDAIYKAYQNVLPKRHHKVIPTLEEQTAEDVKAKLEDKKIKDLFSQE
jgi:adenine-specific DNA-methyltransferase